MLGLVKIGFVDIRLLDLLDIVLAAVLMYQVYKLLKGSLAFNIFIGILLIYLFHSLVNFLDMKLLSGILNQFVGVGVLALFIVFQPEIRRFLLFIGRGSGIGKDGFWRTIFANQFNSEKTLDAVSDQIVRAINSLANTKTGALMVLTQEGEKPFFATTGTQIGANISSKLIESVFMKNAPLHDGAMVVVGNKIEAAGCVLPVSENPDLPSTIGMRHKAAVGITENIEAQVIVVSEETGKISVANRGNIRINVNQTELRNAIQKGLNLGVDSSEN